MRRSRQTARARLPHYVIPMTQVFAPVPKDMLEKADLPRGQAFADLAPEPPYDVTAWSLGMLLGVDTVFREDALPQSR